MYKPVEKVGGDATWETRDFYYNILLTAKPYIKDIIELLYASTVVRDERLAVVFAYLIILLESDDN